MKDTKEVSIRCEDHAECAVFTQYKWDDGDTWYEVTIEDSYCGDSGYTGLLGRFKRAWKAFWARPVYYSSVCVDSPYRMKQFLVDCLDIVNEEIGV